MGLLDGLGDIGSSALKIVTSPARAAARLVDTGLETGGKVLGDLGHGDLSGAASDTVNGAKQQFSNLVAQPGELLGNAQQMAGGYGQVLGSGARLLGEPIKGAAQLAANSVATPLNVTGNLLQGNFNGAVQAGADGIGNSLQIVGNTASSQLHNFF